MNDITKVIAVQNYGPSGTLLMQSLLDGHPQILSLPALHAHQLLVFWETFQNAPRDKIFQEFDTAYRFWFTEVKLFHDLGLTTMGPNFDEKALVNRDTFFQHLTTLWPDEGTITRKHFLLSVFIAYNHALGRDISCCEYLLFPIHCLPQKYALQLVEDFAEVKFLHMVREPVQSMGSLAVHINKYDIWDVHPLLGSVTAQMLLDFTIHAGSHFAYGMYPYTPDTPSRSVQSRAVRLEDLHLNNRKIMQQVCDWLQLEWQDSLLQSTYNGKQWNNRSESIRKHGFGTETISQTHPQILSAFDKLRLRLLSVPFHKHFNYTLTLKFHEKILLWFLPILLCLPFRMERLTDRRQRKTAVIQLKNKTNYPTADRHLIKKILRHLRLAYHNYKDITGKGLKEFYGCRARWLIPAWKRVIQKTPQPFVNLLNKE